MAIFVMLIIIILNIVLLIMVMRIGTQGEHYSELSADQSTAVLAWYDRLGLPKPEPEQVAVVREHAEDVVNTIDPEAELPPTDPDATKDVTEDEDAVAKFANGDDTADVGGELAISDEDAKEEIENLEEAASHLKDEVIDGDESDD